VKEAVSRSLQDSGRKVKSKLKPLRYANAGADMQMHIIRELKGKVFSDDKFQQIIPEMISLARKCDSFEETLSDCIASAVKTMKFDFWEKYSSLNMSRKKAVVSLLVNSVLETIPEDTV